MLLLFFPIFKACQIKIVKNWYKKINISATEEIRGIRNSQYYYCGHIMNSEKKFDSRL